MESNSKNHLKPTITHPEQKVDCMHVSDIVRDFAVYAKSATSEHQQKPAVFTCEHEVDYIHVSDVLADFPNLANFASKCHLPRLVAVAEAPSDVLKRLAPLKFSAKVHLLEIGELHRAWEREAGSHFYTVPGVVEGSWHVMLELMGPKKRLIVGWVLAAFGHFVEDIASNKGYMKGKLALRETSFDIAVKVISRATGFPEDHDELRQEADTLVGILNGAWVSFATGFHERHSCIDLLMHCTTNNSKGGNNLLAKFVEKHAEALASMLSMPDFYYQHVHQDEGWESEKQMCMVMDSATRLLLQDLL